MSGLDATQIDLMLTYDPPKDNQQSCDQERLRNGGCYFPDPGLRDAVNVALSLELPLLLTGAPGTGKTMLADSLAYELGLDRPLRFVTKSNSVSRDLFYNYDALGRFQAKESGLSVDHLNFFEYHALGKAILNSKGAEELTAEDSPYSVADIIPKLFKHPGKCRSVVLIDEIDKAPRDFPNDLLNEIEHMYFRIPEMQNIEVRADSDLKPIVIITSNSEKDLPDPFLRRCIYYHIPNPSIERLHTILVNRLGDTLRGRDQFVGDALGLFERLRADDDVPWTPSTAELIQWVAAMRRRAPDSANPIRENRDALFGCLGAIVKKRIDDVELRSLVQDWLENISG